MMNDDTALSPMYPFLYAHDVFSNMFDKINHHISVSWSLYANQDDGKLIVIQSEPEILVDNEIVNLPDDDGKLLHQIFENESVCLSLMFIVYLKK